MEFITEPKRQLPIKKECDVFVAGGGIAGAAAAIAAARCGKRVVLAEAECALGGLATLGLVTIFLPLCDGEGNQVIFGLGEELLRLSIQHGFESRYPKAWLENGSREERIRQRFQVQYNAQMFAMLLEQLLLEEGVEILYRTKVYGVDCPQNTINAVFLDSKEGRCALRASTVVDATGDADICAFCGDEVAHYTKNRFAAWHYISGKHGYQCVPHAVAINCPLPETERTYDGLKSEDETALIIRGHQEILKNVIKLRGGKCDGSVVPATIPTVPNVRMTRRIMGHYTLSDTEAFQRFSDCVGLTGDWRKRGPVYQIPYRCLYSKHVSNLITAGRCISVDEGMWDITRVIPTCVVTGQAAGTAAALAADAGTPFGHLDIRLLQNRLKRDGVLLSYPSGIQQPE